MSDPKRQLVGKNGELDEIAVYRELLGVPTISTAWFTQGESGSGSDSAVVLQQQKDVLRDELRSYITAYNISTADGNNVIGFPWELTASFMFAVPSPSGKMLAVALSRENKTDKSKTDYSIAIYNRGRLIHVSEPNSKHGKIYKDGPFGGLAWSPDETLVAYVAEIKPPTSKSFFAPNDEKPKGDDKPKDSSSTESIGTQNEVYEDWGEQMKGIRSPAVFTLRVSDGSVDRITTQDMSFGQPVFVQIAGALGLVVVGREHTARRLGQVYFNSRASALYYIELDGPDADSDNNKRRRTSVNGNGQDSSNQPQKLRQLTDDASAMDPRLSPCGKNLLYCAGDPLWPHNNSLRLRILDLEATLNGQQPCVRTVVETVDDPVFGEFPGLYISNIPRRPWLTPTTFVLESSWGIVVKVLLINIESGSVTPLEIPAKLSLPNAAPLSANVYDATKGKLLVALSGTMLPHALYVVKPAAEEWVNLTEHHKWQHMDPKLFNSKVVRLEKQGIEFMVAQPPVSPGRGLVLIMHGGPHSVSNTAYNADNGYFLAMGFAVCVVNYRGSTGYGNRLLLSLIGHIGRNDVDDCVTALNAAVAELPSGWVRPDQYIAWGGSHGGFLTTHLIGQYPSLFSAAATRNPVVNLAWMAGCTDIPDWIAVEAGLCSHVRDHTGYDPTRAFTPEQMKILAEKSPIRLVESVKTPLLLLVGGEDRRVPAGQSLDYLRLLRARGVPCRAHFYPGSTHGMHEPAACADVAVNTMQWLLKYTPK